MFEIIIGVAIGYFFKPQLDKVVHKAIRAINSKQRKDN